ncbi:MAG: FAD-binding oxidoreductase [Magnetococcales bacterium]|nr:FAD-binding oxidoreductase [Magnetococcales bacterium]
MTQRYQSWGRYPKASHQIQTIQWPEDLPNDLTKQIHGALPFGNGRSYGDCCLNDGGLLLDGRFRNRLLAFDAHSGILRCEAGVLLADILELMTPRGWFPAVTPGTKLLTVGGAIANDVHGKNHHRTGSFGDHVHRIGLLRSDGQQLICSPDENTDLFRATIGGIGLTGYILWAEFSLRPISNPYFDMETIRYGNVEDFFQLSSESDQDYEYTLAWLDCQGRGKNLGRGLFMRGNHAPFIPQAQWPKHASRQLNMPIDPPFTLINGLTLKAFNTLYYYKQIRRSQCACVHYDSFFYPLDAIDNWNRIYGPKGFFQYQCVLPQESGQDGIKEILKGIARSGQGSFLGVLKVFGDRQSPGLLSFPRPGSTLALDFPNRGKKTLTLLERFDTIVREAGGAVYIAKDARMSPSSFRHFYPQWQTFKSFVDPGFSSSFWRRVTEESS